MPSPAESVIAPIVGRASALKGMGQPHPVPDVVRQGTRIGRGTPGKEASVVG
jgi:hypothetical protein